MSKRSIKFPFVWSIKVSRLTSVFRWKKDNFVHTIVWNKRTDSHNFKHIFVFTFNDFLCHLKLNRGKSSRVNHRNITGCFWRKHRRDHHVSKIAWKPFKLPLSRLANENVLMKLLSFICITSIIYIIYSLKHFQFMKDLVVVIALNRWSSFSKHLVKCLRKMKLLFISLGRSLLCIYLYQLPIIFKKILWRVFQLSKLGISYPIEGHHCAN